MDKKLWGGRFKTSQDEKFWKFQSSIDCDKVLAEYDIAGSIAHVKMLSKCSIIPKKSAQSILKGLVKIQKDVKSGSFKIDQKAEDIHSAVYIALKNLTGACADYMHTARSRNDQVCLDMRMYVKDKAASLSGLVSALQSALVGAAKKHIDVIIPGLTHTQHAVPVLLSHQLLAYVEMLERDKMRLAQAGERADEMPLGACALAGTSFTIDRRYVAGLLGFSKISQNSIDAVSDRDFILDMLSAIAIFFMHISRLCEDMILFSTSEFKILDIAEAFCTGSSIMPQKKNPDALELIRGTAAEVYANLSSVLVMMKALPLSYNRDMQLDKKPLFDSVEKSEYALSIIAGIVNGIKVHHDNAAASAGSDECLLALDIADYLVRQGLAFKDAHDITGKLVVYCAEKQINFSVLSIDQLRAFSGKFGPDFFKILDVKKSVENKRSIGSTNPILVRQQIDRWVKKLKANR
jgi:argininosuccinate lyase